MLGASGKVQAARSIAWRLTVKHYLVLKAESQGGDFQVSELGAGQGQGNFPLACYPTKDVFCLRVSECWVRSVVTRLCRCC